MHTSHHYKANISISNDSLMRFSLQQAIQSSVEETTEGCSASRGCKALGSRHLATKGNFFKTNTSTGTALSWFS